MCNIALSNRTFQIDWTTYMDNFFDGVDVTIADDEDIVNVEPDYFNAFMAAFDDLDQETVGAWQNQTLQII